MPHDRNTHDGMPEICDAYKHGEHHFAAIQVEIMGVAKTLELGICQNSYGVLKRVLQTRPFDAMPGVEYRYLFTGTYSGHDPREMQIRIEQLQSTGRVTADGFMFEAPKHLIANLLWLKELRSFREASHLRVVDLDRR